MKIVHHPLPLAVAAALAGLLVPAVTVAQQPPPSADQATALDRVVVTGSRIQAIDTESPNPITQIDREQIAYSGKTDVQDVVNRVGALVGSARNDETGNGESQLILRNLGPNRTLVLVDGHRFVGGSAGSTAVDVNVIPTALVERVDVLTGGASAIYGADAVTGVVNFVLRRNFEGLAIEGQYGDAQKGSFRDQQYSLTLGRNFSDSRGNITASYTYGERPLTLSSKRRQASTGLYEQVNNLDGSIPRYVLMSGTNEAFFTLGGARIDPFNPVAGFNGDGTPFKHGINVGSFGGTGEIGGDGIPTWMLFTQAIRPMTERHLLSLKTEYDINDQIRPYASILYADVDNHSYAQHSLTVGSQVRRDNAFLPANVLAHFGGPDGAGPIHFNRWDLNAG
ncbi:MAG: TonB-dependent receptor plug domain-containing protein, partial [Pseudomonadota bacterium]|nr:TonB-dependent receptor plug domain-containing protein [Pseudomonadota bacterium]